MKDTALPLRTASPVFATDSDGVQLTLNVQSSQKLQTNLESEHKGLLKLTKKLTQHEDLEF